MGCFVVNWFEHSIALELGEASSHLIYLHLTWDVFHHSKSQINNFAALKSINTHPFNTQLNPTLFSTAMELLPILEPLGKPKEGIW